MAKSGLPILTASGVQLFQLEVPGGAVGLSPESAFRHFVQLALLKLDFLDRGRRAAERGRPLVDVRAWMPEGIADSADEGDDGEVAEDEPESEASSAHRGRPPLNLILYGPPGTGKTDHLLTGLAPRFTKTELAKAPRSQIFRGGKSWRSPWRIWAARPMSKPRRSSVAQSQIRRAGHPHEAEPDRVGAAPAAHGGVERSSQVFAALRHAAL